MNLSLKGFSAIILCAFVFGVTGCEQEGTAEKAGQKIDQAVEKAGAKIEKAEEAIGNKAEMAVATMDDSAITARIKTEFLSDPLLKAAQFDVITTAGVVKLSGLVDSQLSIDRALEIVKSIKEVKSVENALVVKKP